MRKRKFAVQLGILFSQCFKRENWTFLSTRNHKSCLTEPHFKHLCEELESDSWFFISTVEYSCQKMPEMFCGRPNFTRLLHQHGGEEIMTEFSLSFFFFFFFLTVNSSSQLCAQSKVPVALRRNSHEEEASTTTTRQQSSPVFSAQLRNGQTPFVWPLRLFHLAWIPPTMFSPWPTCCS